MSLSLAARRTGLRTVSQYYVRRTLATEATATTSTATPPDAVTASQTSEPNTHYRITLRRSAISLSEKVKGTLLALGIHWRHQTVYHRHNPETAGKILAVKELVEVENVPASAVRTQTEQRRERKAPRGYKVAGSKIGSVL